MGFQCRRGVVDCTSVLKLRRALDEPYNRVAIASRCDGVDRVSSEESIRIVACSLSKVSQSQASTREEEKGWSKSEDETMYSGAVV